MGGEAGLRLVAKGVAANSSLESLVLDGAAIPVMVRLRSLASIVQATFPNTCSFVQTLRGTTGEVEVDLSNKRLGPESAEIISELLRGNRILRTLNLSENRIGNQGAHAIAAAIKRNRTLTQLNLRANVGIREKTLELLRSVVDHLSADLD